MNNETPLVGSAAPTARREEVRLAVFRDRRGNQFVFLGLKHEAGTWGRRRAACAALGVSEEDEPLTVLVENGAYIFPHVEASAGSSGFAHGSSTVYLIGGPEFDQEFDQVARSAAEGASPERVSPSSYSVRQGEK